MEKNLAYYMKQVSHRARTILIMQYWFLSRFTFSCVFGTLQPSLKCLITPYYADDVNEIPNSERDQVMENSITASESSASGRTTNVVIEVSTNDASSSKININLESSSIEVAIKDNVEISGFNKGLDVSDISETYSSSIEVCHLNASK
jgi:hypothetical protein